MMVVTMRNYSVGRRQRYDEPRPSRLGPLSLLLTVVCLLMFASAGPIYRSGLLGLAGAFRVMRWALYAGGGALVFAVLALIVAARRGRGMATAVIAVAAVLLVLAIPLSWLRQASRAPRIHDITTDTDRPPLFVAVLPLRAGAPNTAEYGGPEIAAQQHQGYPDLAPLDLAVPPNQAFDRALAAARKLGWDIVASDPASGRIEATDTTFWFGFKDDVVVRIAAAPGGSRADVRSVSRVGLSDVGTNAARIRKYLGELRAAS
jgi:uncharacterized protein (DUF1499 family)